MKSLFLASICFFSVNIKAQVTWADDVAQIVYDNCATCHNPNGIAPFSLMSYQDANAYKSFIDPAVSSGAMPPWTADTSYQRYAHERVLTATERNTIADWISQGAPEGNSANTPPPPVLSTNGFLLQTPDLELQIPTYASNASSTSDDYVCFSLPTGLTSDKRIRAFEVVPGANGIVHHALIYIDPNGTYSTDTVGGNCTGPTTGLLGGFTPGALPTVFPSGGTFNLGMTIPAGSNIVLAMHYPEGSLDVIDSTKIRLFFHDDTTTIREISATPLIQNWGFNIPANTIDTVTDTYTNGSTDMSMLTVFPHMHLIGKSIMSYATTPANDTIPFVRINQWDFNWQDFFAFNNIKKLPAGSTIHGIGVYDNTSTNFNNPNSPPIDIGAGLNTSDEMFLIYFHYLPYQVGDELVDIDSLTMDFILDDNKEIATINPTKAYPNPFSQSTNFSYTLSGNKKVSLYIYDINGRLIEKVLDRKKQIAGTHVVNWNVNSNMNPGVYFYSFNIGGEFSSGKLIYTGK